MRTKRYRSLEELVFGRPAFFECPGSIDDTIRRLTKVTEKRKRRTIFPIFQRSQQCVGTVTGSRVRLAYAHRNWYDLTFSGTLSHRDGVTKVEGKYAVHPLACAEIGVIFTIGLCVLGTATIDVFRESSPFGMQVIVILFMIIWLGWFLLFIRLGISSAEAEIEKIDGMVRAALQHRGA